ncbi:PF13643 domain protein [Bordetella bronchiseptica GA96-01]|nr:PF13643 domain protein [Bordetella bronchiseptica 345]KDC38508.1 PF13643 domain protein [Bordetella bronchiseptica GA96-01]
MYFDGLAIAQSLWERRRRHRFRNGVAPQLSATKLHLRKTGGTMKKADDIHRPQFELKAFRCPHCSVVAQMKWSSLVSAQGSSRVGSDFLQAVCTHCEKPSLWFRHWASLGSTRIPRGGEMAWPTAIVQATQAHPDLPRDCEADFEEARQVASMSPRAAAALLRLCVQKLCVHLGCPGKNINDDIAALVKRGLPVQIKQALDVVRVVGNNAAHPGEMSSEDTSQVVNSLFGLINFIVEQMITQPKEIDRLHSQLPTGALQAIERRDNPATQ